MKHNQILEKLAARHLVDSIEEDVARLVGLAMNPRQDSPFDQDAVASYVLPKLMIRWNCVLNAGTDEVTQNYKQKTFVALAVLLHKNGISDGNITKHALRSIDKLNKGVALSDDFFRKSDQIKALIESLPTPLKRRPSMRESLTFHRAGDVVAIQMSDLFYAAYVHEILNFNESPLIELYDAEFDHRPTLKEVQGTRAKGAYYNDGSERAEKFSVYGMRNLPDLANQIHLIASGVTEAPSTSHLEEPVGLYCVSNLFALMATIPAMFRKPMAS
jgi:hypothetical protein